MIILNVMADMRRTSGAVPRGSVRRTRDWTNYNPVIIGGGSSGGGWGGGGGRRRIFRRRRFVRRRRLVGELVMLISRADKKRISATIAAVEQKTSGEIFCVIARQCGDYRTVPLIWAAALALLLPLPLILCHADAGALDLSRAARAVRRRGAGAVDPGDPLSHRAAPEHARRRHMPKPCGNSARRACTRPKTAPAC